MAVRLFKCKKCGHKLRLGVDNCGKCSAPTPLYNRENVLGLALVLSFSVIFLLAIN
jgi:uncharacterized OB-fold protein